jgi:predicted nucleic acid-binding protein
LRRGLGHYPIEDLRGAWRMIPLDTNLLVYSVREDSPWQKQALSRLRGLAEGGAAWAIPWPCVHEFIAVVTHPRIYQACRPCSPGGVLDGKSLPALDRRASGIVGALEGGLTSGQTMGPLVHDARVAAICRLHGVREIWRADRDYSRFEGLRVRNPLLGSP